MDEPVAHTALTKPKILRTADSDDQRWYLMMFRAGALATLFFQVAYLMHATKAGEEGRLAFDLHLLLVGLPVLAFVLTWCACFQRYCRQVAMAMSIAVIGGMATLSVVNGETIPLFIVSILTLAGTGLLPWSEYWQGTLSAWVLTAFAVVEALVPSGDPYESLRRLGLLTGVGIAQIAVRLGSRYRRTLRSQLEELKSAQSRSSQSEATIRQMLDAIHGLVALTRLRDGKLLEVNQEFLERTGFSRQQVLTGSTRELGLYARPEDRAAFTRTLKTERGVRDLELDFRLKGAVVPHLVSAVVIDFEGEACTVAIGQDITKIKESERALREAQERLSARVEELTLTQERLHAGIAERKGVERIALERETTLRKIFQASPDLITIWRRSDGRYLEINREFSFTGYSREEIVGKRAKDLNVFVNPAQLAARDEALRLEGQVRGMEVQLRHRDGRILDGLTSATVVQLGGETCVISITRDISNIKKTERALRAAQQRLNAQIAELTAAQERLRAEVADRKAAERTAKEREDTLRRIFESTTDGLVIFSLRDGHIIETNSEFSRASGYSREELLAAPQGRIGTWAHPEQRRCFVRELRTAGVVRNMEIEMRSRDGALSPFLLSSSVLELNGEPCAVALIRDITEIKRAHDELLAAREQALAASRSKSEFLSSMSHEIRTPMNAILGMADILSETELDVDQCGYLETMRSNGMVLLSLIDDILDLAKVESGRLQLETVDFDLSELVEKVAETLATRAHGKGLELAARIVPGTPLWVVGDPLRLRQVLMNLLGNAIKFTELGEVVLTVRPGDGLEAGLLHFSVADTGIGIDRDEVGEIFSHFTQADSSTTRKYGGSGLGLAIARRLVRLMDGRIWVESELGNGSTFHFTASLQSSNRANHSPARRNLRSLRVLIADRSSSNRLVLREMLGAYGAAIVEVATVQEMTEVLDKATSTDRPFDVTFADYQMFGVERLVRLARTERGFGARMLIPMITTDDLRTKLEHLRQLGIYTYVRKPIGRADLLEIAARAAATLCGDHAGVSVKTNPRIAPLPNPTPSFVAEAPKSRLLLTDDSPDNRLVVSAFLKRLPFEIEVAENGSVAMDKFACGHYDLVLMDIQMPVLDGYTAVRMMRKFESEHHLPATPILALTASTLEDDVRKALEAGCGAHVAKPIRKEALLAAIAAALEITPTQPRQNEIAASPPALGVPAE
jgi:PAS domain S-box-containing protein